jgi:hypothetical protein
MRRDLTNLKEDHAKLKEGMRATRPKTDALHRHPRAAAELIKQHQLTPIHSSTGTET